MNNIEITNYFKYEPRFNGTFSRSNLPTIKDGSYVINLDDKNSKGAQCVSLFIDRNTAVYFDSFLNGILSSRSFKQIRSKSIIQNVFRMQDNESIMCGIYFITFI